MFVVFPRCLSIASIFCAARKVCPFVPVIFEKLLELFYRQALVRAFCRGSSCTQNFPKNWQSYHLLRTRTFFQKIQRAYLVRCSPVRKRRSDFLATSLRCFKKYYRRPQNVFRATAKSSTWRLIWIQFLFSWKHFHKVRRRAS